ncbi:CHAT domain-containing protein [Russula dissimulans]|nr:CHAT domain-containing protein [Russula dissimulans]
MQELRVALHLGEKCRLFVRFCIDIFVSHVHLAEVKEEEATTVTLTEDTCTLPSRTARVLDGLDHLAGSCNRRIAKTANENLRFTSLRTVSTFLNAKIEKLRVSSSLFPRPHPVRRWVIAGLGSALRGHYLISSQEDDLLAAIPLLTETLLFPFSPEAAPVSLTIKIFYLLACSLASRFKLHRDLRDLEQAVTHYRHILTLPPGALDSLEVLGKLTSLLADKARMGAKVELDLAKEIVRILQRSAARDPSGKYLGPNAENIGRILLSWLDQTDRIAECEQVLRLFTKVEGLCSPELSFDFCFFQGTAFATCFKHTGLYDYSEQAIVRFNKALALLAPEHPLRPLPQTGISLVLRNRFYHNRQPEYLEEAIRHSRAALAACPPAHPLCPVCLEHLSNFLSIRDAFFGNVKFLEEADACIHDAHSEEIPKRLRVLDANFKRDNSLEALEEEIRRKREHLEKIPAGHSDYLNALCSLALACRSKFDRTLKLADLEEETNYYSIALAASPPDHYPRQEILFHLSTSCLRRYLFDQTAVHYLEYSIMYCRDLLELCPHGHMFHCNSVKGALATCLSMRYCALRRQSASENEHTDPFARYTTAATWAGLAQIYRHPSTTLAYEKAMSVIQSPLAVGPTLEIQHRLTGRRGRFMALPLKCASYYIEIGKSESAVEILERGRTLLWSQMRGLRTPIDQLRACGHAMLAEQFVVIGEQLEKIATSTQAPGIYTGTPGGAILVDHPSYSSPDVFSQMMENVRVLERKRGEIADQIRLVPGFADFLKAVPFGTLQTAAACGPVIIINHCRPRSDILIVLHDSPPVLIPTAKDFFTRAAELKQSLLETRTKYPLESMHYEDALRFVLQELYKLVGRPVIGKLRELGIPEQSRVWWCSTSVFCSLPLHAMGPIESETCEEQYFSDLYVPSYTPSLSALIESRKGIVDNPEPPSLLIVGQPDSSLQGVRGEIKAIQRHAPSASSLIGAKGTRARVIKHLRKHQMVHFVCHGRLEPEKPFETGFVLHGDERLTLLDIVRLQLSTAECAFLSVCHAAEWTDKDTADEALHLTAAMQYCGFRSVVGTLWAMADMDGRDLAGQFMGLCLEKTLRSGGWASERDRRGRCGTLCRY